MEYRKLGKTNLKVSVISYGNWLNSEYPDQQERSNRIVRKAWELGINFFDTAEVYGHGEAEKQIGTALKELNVPREDLVVTTKIYFGTDTTLFPNSAFLSRKHIVEGLQTSLQRLQMKYVDICFAHRCDPITPMEEICRAFDWCVRQGLATYWATSEWTPQEIMEAYGICDKLNLQRPICEQLQYSLYIRDHFELDYDRHFGVHGMGATVWSPLCQGLLTGKYNNGIDPKGRLGQSEFIKDNKSIENLVKKFFGSEEERSSTLKCLQDFGNLAQSLGCTQAQLAMAWVIKNRDVSSAITGASHVDQLTDIVGAVQVQKKITPEIDSQIEGFFKNKPLGVYDYIKQVHRPTRREQQV